MTLHVVTGPPCAGKTTWVRDHAKPGDITIDYDALAETLTPTPSRTFDAPMHIVDVAQVARNAAIHVALNKVWHCNVYIIDSRPNDTARQRYEQFGARFIDIDPGYDVCMTRAQSERPPRVQAVVADWYCNAMALG